MRESAGMAETEQSHHRGLSVAKNETLRAFLCSAAQNPDLRDELREIASNLSVQETLPYESIRNIWFASSSSAKPKLIHLFSGSDFVFSSPKPREKSEELNERLRKLAELAERKAYNELVKDVVHRKEIEEPFSSYKDQLGFGLHIVLIMFTGYLVGYAMFRALFSHSAAMNAAGGIFGLVFGMLLETVLFIIRSNNQEIRSKRSASALKKRQ